MKTIILFLLFMVCFTHSKAQVRYLPLTDFSMHDVTAQYQDDTTTVYSLLCTGVPTNIIKTDSLIRTWLGSHRDATLRPVCSFSYYNSMGNRVTFTYSWIVSNEKMDPSLNVYLVRNRGCNAASMLWAKNPAILKPAIDYYIKKKSETKIFIDKATYKKFTYKLKTATPVIDKHIKK